MSDISHKSSGSVRRPLSPSFPPRRSSPPTTRVSSSHARLPHPRHSPPCLHALPESLLRLAALASHVRLIPLHHHAHTHQISKSTVSQQSDYLGSHSPHDHPRRQHPFLRGSMNFVDDRGFRPRYVYVYQSQALTLYSRRRKSKDNLHNHGHQNTSIINQANGGLLFPDPKQPQDAPLAC